MQFNYMDGVSQALHAMSDQTPESHSIEVVPDNLPTTTDKIHTQLPMLGAMDLDSRIQEQVLVSGGAFNSINHTLLTELES
jgi:hypothetical protein